MRKLSIIAFAFITAATISSYGASAASPKAGDPCSKRNTMTTIGGKKFVCDAPVNQWKTSTKFTWIDIAKYSKDKEKLTATFDEKTMYQYCLVMNGGPLPGKGGNVPDGALKNCQGLPGAPKPAGAANNSSNDPSQGFPSNVSQAYLDCLSKNGYSPKNFNELLVEIHTTKYESAYKACNSLAPSMIASQIKK